MKNQLAMVSVVTQEFDIGVIQDGVPFSKQLEIQSDVSDFINESLVTGNLFSESAVVDDYGSYRITNNSDTKCPCVACNMEESS